MGLGEIGAKARTGALATASFAKLLGSDLTEKTV